MTKLGRGEPVARMLDKQFLMGIAITFVWLYHLRCTCHHLGDPLFKPLFIGVDIFLFLSAYGLCFSYNKNTLGQFYKNRIKRVYPLFAIMAISYTPLKAVKGYDSSAWDWFCNLSTLSYYGLGGIYISWYLSLQLLLYLLFPILYKVSKKYASYLLVLSLCCSILLLATIEWHWRYDCFISRIPIFILGILFYLERESVNLRKALGFSCLSSCLGGQFLWSLTLISY